MFPAHQLAARLLLTRPPYLCCCCCLKSHFCRAVLHLSFVAPPKKIICTFFFGRQSSRQCQVQDEVGTFCFAHTLSGNRGAYPIDAPSRAVQLRKRAPPSHRLKVQSTLVQRGNKGQRFGIRRQEKRKKERLVILMEASKHMI